MRSLLFSAVTALAAVGAAAFAISPRNEIPDPGKVSSNEPVLLELFTSQGCSSCPPADRLAARLAQETGLIVVSRPVTYWDRLGWKDTLAREENTQLQRQYARRGLGGRNGVYTPQMVADGTYGTVGSFEDDVRRMVRAARANDQVAIRTQENDAGDWVIGIGGEADSDAELVLIGVDRDPSVAIGRGENAGREITYTNVLRHERKLASWSGGKKSHVITTASLQDMPADQYVLILREPGGGKVLASSWLK